MFALFLLAISSLSFGYINRERDFSKPLLTIKNKAIATAIEDVINREPNKSNVLLLFVDSNINRSLSVSIVAIDSFSVAQFLRHRIRNVKGALAYRKDILLVSGNAVEKVFSYSAKEFNVPFIDRYKLNESQPPVPIDAIVYIYEYNEGRFTFKVARF
jgi:hypothetical protein